MGSWKRMVLWVSCGALVAPGLSPAAVSSGAGTSPAAAPVVKPAPPAAPEVIPIEEAEESGPAPAAGATAKTASPPAEVPIPPVRDLSVVKPPIALAPAKEEKRISLHLRDLPLETVLQAITAQTGINFIASGNLKNIRLTSLLQDVTLSEALEALLDANGLSYEQIGSSNIYVVKERKDTQPRRVTRVFRLKYIQLAEAGKKDEAGKSSSPGISIVDTSGKPSGGGDSDKTEKTDSSSAIVSIIKSMLTADGNLQVDMHTNSLIVTDLPSVFPRVERAILDLDMLVPQIVIEVKIVERQSSENDQRGFEIGGPNGELGNYTGPARVVSGPLLDGHGGLFPSAASLQTAKPTIVGQYGGDPLKGLSYGILSFQQFNVLLHMIQVEGKSRYLASPNVLTLNNKPAEISIMADTAVGMQSASLIAQSGLLVATAERRPTGIYMKVTPQVNAESLVTLLIDASISRPQASTFFPDKFVDPQSQAVRTSITVKDKDTVRIGGLIAEDDAEIVRKLPLLGDIPLLKYLFTFKKKTKLVREITIFITPKIMVL